MAVSFDRRLTHDDYDVVIICPLEVEVSAVRYMLDEEHARLPSKDGDSNRYLYGRMSGYNVVIAYLPQGSQGVGAAAVVATDIKRSFPHALLRLLVGIGGGVPGTAHDVRLGDVVVGMPNGQHGGVVQYDLGKDTTNGFERKGILESPPTIFRNCVVEMQSDHRTKHNKITAFVNEMIKRHPSLSEYGRPTTEEDILFMATNKHILDEPTCASCDRTQVVARPSRTRSTPQIFYGLIASGNRVEKNAELRDQIAKDAGGALCFEMEAAGLMNDFRCLVIRGISDYADSHKNDMWHAYAAAVAAGCAKELLSFAAQEVQIASPRMRSTGQDYGTHVNYDIRAHIGDIHNYPSDYVQAARLLQQGSDLVGANGDRATPPPCDFRVSKSSTTYFTGRRQQLQDLRSTLVSSKDPLHRRRVVVVHGLGGSGKTQFCLKYAEDNQVSYRSIFWIDASSPEAADHSYKELSRHYGKGITAAAGKYCVSQSKKPWLLILDNIDRDVDISDILPPGNAGHILITTRNQSVTANNTHGVISLDKMDAEDAIELLLKTAYPRDAEARLQVASRKAASAIVDKLRCLAIAVWHAGTTICRRIYTLDKYLSSYLDRKQDLLSQRRSIDKLEEDVIATWEIPFKRLEENIRESCQDAVALMNILAFLHHEAIHVSMLEAPSKSPEQEIQSTEKLPRIIQWEEADQEEARERLRIALSILYDYSIIEYDERSRVCSIHPVVHQWAKTRIVDRQKIQYWLRCTSFMLACAAPKGRINYGDNNIEIDTSVAHLVPHVTNFLQLSGSHDPSFRNTPGGIAHIEQMTKVYEQSSSWSLAVEHLSIVLDFQEKKRGARHHDTIRIKRRISDCLWHLFDIKSAVKYDIEILQARYLRRPSLADWRYPLKPRHIEYLLALNNLSVALWIGGEHKWSRVAAEYAVSRLKLTIGERDDRTLEAMFILGRTYRHLGLQSEAGRMLTSVLQQHKSRDAREIRKRRAKGEDDPKSNNLDTLMVKNELALHFCHLGIHLVAAERMIRSVVDGRTRILGEEAPYTLWAKNDLAIVFSTRGRPADALRLLAEVAPAVQRALGEQHIGVHMCFGNIVWAHSLLHNWPEAEQYVNQLDRMMEDDHPDHRHLLAGMAYIKIKLGKWDEAERLCNDLLAWFESPPPRSSAMVLVSWLEWALTKPSPRANFKVDVPYAAGLLSAVYKGQGETEKLEILRIKYRPLDEEVINRSFKFI